MSDWFQDWMDEEREAGRQSGLEEGRKKGLAEGRKKGIVEGKKEGRIEEQEELLILYEHLSKNNRQDEMYRAIKDTGFRETLLAEFNIKPV